MLLLSARLQTPAPPCFRDERPSAALPVQKVYKEPDKHCFVEENSCLEVIFVRVFRNVSLLVRGGSNRPLFFCAPVKEF